MSRIAVVLVLSCLTLPDASAWDYEGHRAVNLLALQSLPAEFPSFTKTPEATERVAFLGGEPDRWRNVPDVSINHQNGLDHYIDFEDLDRAEINPRDLPAQRSLFSAAMGIAKKEHPERFPASTGSSDRYQVYDYAGHLPWAIAEHYGRLRSAFSYLKAYEDAGTPEEVANARANALYTMGVLGHFVGDGAQPLHTTRHFNGWVGENPGGYTTAKTFHSHIDGDFLRATGGISAERLAHRMPPATLLPLVDNPAIDPVFTAVLEYLLLQHTQVEPLYLAEKEGKLTAGAPGAQQGRDLLEAQVLAGGRMLATLWFTAWRNAVPDKYLIGKLAERKMNAGQH